MLPRILGATIVLAWALSVPTLAVAQLMPPPPPQIPPIDTTVTFNIPVNLTQLSPDVERVRALCTISSVALTIPQGVFGPPVPESAPHDEAWVVLGKVEKTMQVVLPLATAWLQSPAGKTADYQCFLIGFTKSQQRWDVFSDTSTTAALRLNPTPQTLQGTFVW